MTDAIDFFNASNGKEFLKRAIISSSKVYSTCCFRHYTNQKACFYGASSDCFSCPFKALEVPTVQRIRDLWIYINMHNNQSTDDDITTIANAYLYIILADLVEGLNDCFLGHDILEYVYNLTDFQKMVRLIEVLVDACNEI